MMWTKKERLLSVLHGELADRPPVSAWRHFQETEHSTPLDFAASMLIFQGKYDWDYIKMQPRATYYEEAWGSEFDFSDYKGGNVPSSIKKSISGMQDLEKIVELPGNSGPFAEQLEAIQIIQKGVKDNTPIFQTIFCPSAVFQKLCAIDSIGRYRSATRSDLMITLFREHPELVHKALKNITRTLANYSKEMAKIDTFGVFYAATGLSRTGYLTRDEWDEFVRPYDMELLEALMPLKVMLHACGIYCNPERFADYPIAILHWAESAPGNPPLNSSPNWLKGKTPMGGVDERLFGQNKSLEIVQVTRDTLKKMKKIPFVLAPDCSVDKNTSHEELMAFINTAHEAI